MATAKDGFSTVCTICDVNDEPFSIVNAVELTCGHKFCTECICHYAKHHGDGNKFPCPVCRQQTELSAIDCQTGEKSTTLQKETDQQEETELTTRLRCPRHPNDVRYFYCRTCQVFICMNCTVVDHPRDTHGIVNRRDIEEEVKNNAETLIKQSKIKRQWISRQMEDIIKNKNGTTTAINKIKESITKAGDDIINQVKSQVQSLLDEADQKQKILEPKVEALVNKCTQFDASIESAVGKLNDVTQSLLTDESIQANENISKILEQKLEENIDTNTTDLMMRYIAELHFESDNSSAPSVGRIQEPDAAWELHTKGTFQEYTARGPKFVGI